MSLLTEPKKSLPGPQLAPPAGRSDEDRLPFLHSLRWRLPALVGGLVLIMLATFIWATYRQVEGTVVRAGQERARQAADEIAGILEVALQGLQQEDAAMRANSVVANFLRDPTAANEAAARAELAPDQAFRRVEVWSAGDSLLLEIATPRSDSTAGPQYLPAGTAPLAEGLSTFKAAGEIVFFDDVVAIPDAASAGGARLGYVRRFGQITTNTDGRIMRLLGDSAEIRLGSPEGGVWTDLFGPVDAPPLARPASGATANPADNAGDADRWVQASVPISGSPWLVWVGFPHAMITQPVRALVQRMLAGGLVFVLIGVVLAGGIGVRLTQPLHALAKAAEEIAAGDYSRRVSTGRRDEIGRLSHAFNTMTDRIEEAQNALRESHRQTHFALAAAGIGVWKVELDSGEVNCSDSMRLVHGLAPDMPLPRSRDALLELIHADDRAAVRDLLSGGAPKDAAFDLNYRALWSDGSTHSIEGKGRVKVDDAGNATSVFGVSMDLTEKRKLETQLRQAQKMEAVGRLAGGIAHDFNNLLSVITGTTQLALMEELESVQLRGDLEEISRAADRAADLTRQLLAFSRRQILQPAIVDLNGVVKGTQSMLERTLGEDLTFNVRLARKLGSVKADPGQMEQILMNLAINARDAMPSGGTLTIETRNEDVDNPQPLPYDNPIQPGSYVLLRVRDTGEGMSATVREQIFDPFFTTKPAGKGTGLGLSTVYGIVKQSGGHVKVDSEVGRGTTFSIYLPRLDAGSETITTPFMNG